MDEEFSKIITKTGTVTLGLVCKEGIVLAADRRTSYAGQGGVSYLAGQLKKIIELNERSVSTVAGTASDAERTLQIAKAELRLKELKTKEKVSVKETANLLANMAYGSIRTPSMIPNIAHFVLAGYDDDGVHLFDISPDGLMKEYKTYVASGAGIMQVHPILDSEYKEGMTIDQGIELAIKCITASMGRDPSVGEGIDIYTIKPTEVKQVLAKKFVPELK